MTTLEFNWDEYVKTFDANQVWASIKTHVAIKGVYLRTACAKKGEKRSTAKIAKDLTIKIAEKYYPILGTIGVPDEDNCVDLYFIFDLGEIIPDMIWKLIETASVIVPARDNEYGKDAKISVEDPAGTMLNQALREAESRVKEGLDNGWEELEKEL